MSAPLRVASDPTPRPAPVVLRLCWKCREKFLEAEFANGRCNTCTTTEQRNTTIRLAVRVLRGTAYSGRSRQRSVWRLMARSVERQAELAGIDCSIPEPERWSHG